MDSVAQSNSGRSERFILFTIIATMIVNQTGVVIVSPLVVQIAASFDVSVSAVGQLRTVAALTSAVLAPLAGIYSDRVGRRPFMMLGLVSIALYGIGSAIAPNFAVLMAVQAIGGIGIAALMSMAYVAVADYFPSERRSWAIGVISTGQPLAWVIGLPIIGILADIADWRASFLGVPFLFSLIGFWFVWRLPPATELPDQPANQSVFTSLSDVFKDRVAASWVITELLAYSGWSGTLVFLGAFYINIYDLSTTLTSVFLSVTATAFVCGSLVSSRISAQFSEQRAILVTAWGSAAFLILAMVFRLGAIPTLGVLMLFGFLQGIRGAAASTLGMRQPPRYRSVLMGMRASVVQLGYVVGGTFGGLLLYLGGYSALGITFAGLICIAALGVYLLVTVPADSTPSPTSAQ